MVENQKGAVFAAGCQLIVGFTVINLYSTFRPSLEMQIMIWAMPLRPWETLHESSRHFMHCKSPIEARAKLKTVVAITVDDHTPAYQVISRGP